MLGVATCFCCNGVVFHTEEEVPNFGEGGGPKFCEAPALVTCFCCTGVVLSAEGLLSNF